MEELTDHNASTPAGYPTSLDTSKQPSMPASTSPPQRTSADLITTQKAIAGLSQMSLAISDQVLPSIEKAEENETTLAAVLSGLSSIYTAAPDETESSSLQRKDQPATPTTFVPSHTPPFAAWLNRALEKKKRRSDSLSSASSASTSIPKRQRLFDLSDDADAPRIGSVRNPIPLPLVYNTPFVDTLAITSPEPAKKQPQIREKRKEKISNFSYQGIHSLLQCDGRPVFFPDRAQSLIEKQQKRSYKTIRISRRAFDQSFAESMINDGKGKIGERSFSSTGANVSGAARMPFETPEVPVIVEASEDVGAGLTSSEKVLGSCWLLETILIRYVEIEAHAMVLQAQGVNKLFKRVISKSTKLRRML